ncbi:hypothetical protein TGPRC2_426800 [Toxoplasma gondii TgCatPRC2]|uniref:Uncharacterized protein n=1 Tax=Toxoplasma gondii TgCatPRC2 TaxID=1130821 RepID=A0A151H2L0_TOXGO|nr:hypothetical protein TGPRC2_426800 [Toxoplasma gondii TgCatPRC2]
MQKTRLQRTTQGTVNQLLSLLLLELLLLLLGSCDLLLKAETLKLRSGLARRPSRETVWGGVPRACEEDRAVRPSEGPRAREAHAACVPRRRGSDCGGSEQLLLLQSLLEVRSVVQASRKKERSSLAGLHIRTWASTSP